MENQTIVIAVMNAAMLLAGVIIGGGGVLAILTRINQRPDVINAIEDVLMRALPPEQLERINQIARTLEVAADTIDRATDGVTEEVSNGDN